MNCDLRFIAVPTVDTPGTLLSLNFEDKRYLFGRVAEGSQRICLQRGLSLIKTQAVFISGKVGWENTGGLTGLALTLADTLSTRTKSMVQSGKEVSKHDLTEDGLVVYGGNGLLYSVAAGRKYILRVGGRVKFQEFEDKKAGEPDFQDHNIRVWTLKVNPDKLEDENDSSNSRKHNALERRTEPRQTLQKIVKQMWESKWRLDNLVEKELQDVELPVSAVWVRDPVTKDLKAYTGPFADGETPLEDPTMKVLIRRPWPAAITGDLPSCQPNREAVSYLVKTFPRRGKFLVEKAKEHNVKKGRDYSRLSAGESVQSEDGKTITPDMVLEPERPGNGIFIIDIPSLDYVQNFVGRSEWNDSNAMHGIDLMIWILGPGVSSCPAIQTFMEKMRMVKHVVSSPDHCPNEITLSAVHRMAMLIGYINPINYTVPIFDNEGIPQTTLALGQRNKTELPADVIPASPLLTASNRSDFQIERHLSEPFEELDISKKTQSLAKKAQSTNNEREENYAIWKSTIALPDTEVIFLGTGSAIPSLTRNVTGILLRVPGFGNYILDCGENTLGQLKRMYSGDELVEILRDLRMIWISHIHADHHLGTIGMIKAWYEAVHQSIPIPRPTSTPGLISQLEAAPESRHRLALVAGEAFQDTVADFSNLEDIGYSRVLPIVHNPASIHIPSRTIQTPTRLHIKTKHLTGNKNDMDAQLDPALHSRIFGLLDIQTVPVKHCRDAAALCLTFNPPPIQISSTPTATHNHPFRVAWSGDCRPSALFAIVAESADLLIHEATFGSGLEGQAKAKAHSTVKEAKRVAEAMGAKSLLLTHFSQRYSKLPCTDDLEEHLEGKEKALQILIDNIQAERSLLIEEEGEAEVLEGDINAMDGVEATGTPAEPQDEPTEQQLDANEDAEDESHLSAEFEPPTQLLQLPVAIAFDYMRVRVGDIPRLNAYIPALVHLFKDTKRLHADVDVLPVAPKATNHITAKARKKKRKNEEIAERKRRRTMERESSSEKNSNVEKNKDADKIEVDLAVEEKVMAATGL